MIVVLSERIDYLEAERDKWLEQLRDDEIDGMMRAFITENTTVNPA